VNLQGLGDELNSEIINQLETYGFALIDDGTEDIFYPVDYDFNLETPMYISTDLCLHVLHSIFDNCLRIIEMEYFYGNFSSMINTLREDQMDLYTVIVEPELKEALQYNVAYLTVLMQLLDDTTSIPSYVNTLVSDELDNLEQGVEDYSAIFGYLEDYTQYKPRGHYTRSDAFKRYFRTMMYAGRMGFVLDDQSASNPIGVKQTRMALALVYSFNEEIGDKVVWDYWDKICRTTDFLVGGSDDLTPVEYFSVWEEFSGDFFEIDKIQIPDVKLRMIDSNSAFLDPNTRVRKSPVEQIDLAAYPYFNITRMEAVKTEFREFLNYTLKTGYNSLQIEEFGHLVTFDDVIDGQIVENYEIFAEDDPFRIRHEQYQEYYSDFFEEADNLGISTYVYTRIPYLPQPVEDYLGGLNPSNFERIVSLYINAINEFFTRFPTVDGLQVITGEVGGSHNVLDYYGATHVMKLGQTCQRRSNRRLGGSPHVR
ncbi:unnamed protein product, partial [marine sediment metagenome]